MCDKVFTDVWCSKTGEIGVTINGIVHIFLSEDFEDFLNEMVNEKELLKSEIMDILKSIDGEDCLKNIVCFKAFNNIKELVE